MGENGALAAREICDELVRNDISIAAMLPDTWMRDLLRELTDDTRITSVEVAAEPEGVGICAGAYFGGAGSCLVMANAGLMLCGYAIPTLTMMHRLPLLMLISLRGKVGDAAFYQEYQGLLTEPLLDLMDVGQVVVDNRDQIGRIGEAYRHSRLYKRPTAVLLTKGVLV